MQVKELKNNRVGWIVTDNDFGVIKAYLEQVLKTPDHDYFVEWLVLADLYKRAFCNPFVPKETRIRLTWIEVLSFHTYCPNEPGNWLFEVATEGYEIIDRQTGLTHALSAGPNYQKQDLLAG
jgi:hypothetical protein